MKFRCRRCRSVVEEEGEEYEPQYFGGAQASPIFEYRMVECDCGHTIRRVTRSDWISPKIPKIWGSDGIPQGTMFRLCGTSVEITRDECDAGCFIVLKEGKKAKHYDRTEIKFSFNNNDKEEIKSALARLKRYIESTNGEHRRKFPW